jgi:hypothetical protein
MKLSLFAKKTLWWPTWRGWLFLVVLAGGVVVGVMSRLQPFLAVTKPVRANVLVVEGWVPDYVLKEAANEFQQGRYEYLLVTGGPLLKGFLITGYSSEAALAAACLRTLHVLPANQLLEAPCAFTYRNRTFESARAAQTKLLAAGVHVQGVNVITVGTHARRTWLVYRKVFKPQTEIGVICHLDEEYQADRWWQSSAGIKAVMTEGFGWTYEWLASSGRTRDSSVSEPASIPKSP